MSLSTDSFILLSNVGSELCEKMNNSFHIEKELVLVLKPKQITSPNTVFVDCHIVQTYFQICDETVSRKPPKICSGKVITERKLSWLL